MKKILNELKVFWRYENVVPDPLIRSGEFKLLHISDTPSEIHKKIVKLATRLKPDMIIHTGDLLDEIKSGSDTIYPNKILRSLTEFLTQLSGVTGQLAVVPGNHDNEDMLKHLDVHMRILYPGERVAVRRHQVICAHALDELPTNDGEADFFLYGHNFDVPRGNYVVENKNEQYKSIKGTYLNGVQFINVILFPSKQVFLLPYPKGTDYFRRYTKPRRLL